MEQLRFDIDWMDAEGVNGAELAATWASLRIHTESSAITLALDARAKTVRDRLYVSLYPMAEWLATNWWFLTSEVGSPLKQDSAGYRRRHSLAANREGYAYPDLHIFPLGGLTRLVWHRGTVPWAKTRFLEEGEALIDSAEFRETCADLVDSVVARLADCGIEDTLLQQEWAAVRAADAEEADFCRVAAGLGWDPYVLDDAKCEEVLLLADRFGDALEEAVPALNADDTGEGWAIFEQALREAKRRNTLGLERVLSVRDRIFGFSPSDSVPWRAGYELARGLRRELNLDGEPLPTMAALARALDDDAIDAATTRVPVNGRNAILIDGLVTSDEDDAPAFAFRPRGEYGRRFHFCRAIAEVLSRPAVDTLLTPARTERQQRNRAFAAEFLAPASGLSCRVRRSTLDEEEVDELATVFGVSSWVIEHQIAYHQIGRVERSLDATGWPDSSALATTKVLRSKVRHVPESPAKSKKPATRTTFEERFASIRPYLYHLTAASNFERIRRLGWLDCATTLLEAGGRTDLLRKKRGKGGCTVRVGDDDVHVRDQEPLHKGHMALLCGYSFEDFIEYLNSFVFFWPGQDEGPSDYGERYFWRYADERPMLIRIPTADLFAKNRIASPRFCSYNSGAPRQANGKPSPRGPSTFSYGEQYDRQPSNVKEVVYQAAALLPTTAEISCSLQGPWRSLY